MQNLSTFGLTRFETLFKQMQAGPFGPCLHLLEVTILPGHIGERPGGLRPPGSRAASGRSHSLALTVVLHFRSWQGPSGPARGFWLPPYYIYLYFYTLELKSRPSSSRICKDTEILYNNKPCMNFSNFIFYLQNLSTFGLTHFHTTLQIDAGRALRVLPASA